MSIGAEKRRMEGKSRALVPEVPSTMSALRDVKAPLGPDSDSKGSNGVESEHAFDLDYTGPRGYRWHGRFATHILTTREKIQVGLVKARLGGGISPLAMDITTGNILEMLAHLAVSLDKQPSWATDLEGIRDVGVIAAIYEEVASHEARFWSTGAGSIGPDSGEKSGDHA